MEKDMSLGYLKLIKVHVEVLEVPVNLVDGLISG
jgi:hypothetical protein